MSPIPQPPPVLHQHIHMQILSQPFPLIFAIKVKIEKMQAEAFSLYVFGLICLAVVSVSIFVISSANMTHPTRNIAMELLQLNSTTTFYSLNIHKVDDWRQLRQQWRSFLLLRFHAAGSGQLEPPRLVLPPLRAHIWGIQAGPTQL